MHTTSVSFHQVNQIRKYGAFDPEAYIGRMIERVRKLGFNSNGAFSGSVLQAQREAKFGYMSGINGTEIPGLQRVWDPFDEKTREKIEAGLAKRAAEMTGHRQTQTDTDKKEGKTAETRSHEGTKDETTGHRQTQTDTDRKEGKTAETRSHEGTKEEMTGHRQTQTDTDGKKGDATTGRGQTQTDADGKRDGQEGIAVGSVVDWVLPGE